jgi:hypothetical protein
LQRDAAKECDELRKDAGKSHEKPLIARASNWVAVKRSTVAELG